MKPSIRKFLLANLLLTIAFVTLINAIGNYYLDKKSIETHLDTLMAISALSYQALLSENLQENQIASIQKSLSLIPDKVNHYQHQHAINNFFNSKPYFDQLNFQVWTNTGRRILHSYNAPVIPLTMRDGFSDSILEGKTWRVFTALDHHTDIRTILAEQYDSRDLLGRKLALDDLYIMLLTFPFSALLIWFVVGRGLSTLDKIAKEVSSRALTHLEPVNLEKVPDEIKPVIDELNKLFFRLQEAFDREKRFAADAAHELRTPLAALKAQAQVALNTIDVEEKNFVLQKLIASVNRSTHIVQQLLTMSKLVPEAAHLSDMDMVNIIKTTRDVLAMLVPSALDKQVEIEFDHDDVLPHFRGNQTAIGILINNLVDNGIRYCNAGNIITVRLFSENNKLILRVQDNGPGIPTEMRARVFERFFRVLGHKTTGSGLGLAIVKQICDLHHATVELDSPRDGTGLIVRVSFPIAS